MGHAAFVCYCLWCLVVDWVGDLAIVGSREEVGEVCHFLLHVSECI